MKFTVIKSIFDNEILPANRFEMSWERFCKILSKPAIVPKKDSVHLISPVEYLSDEEALDFTDSGKVRRCSDNVKTWYSIPCDIDGQMTLETAQERFKDYEYVLYSTFSHKSEKKNFKDCFRIFFKIKEPISNEDFLCRRNALQDFIGEHDRSTLATSRGFYIFSCPENDAHPVFLHNQGIDLDVLSLPVTVEIPHVSDSIHDAPSYEFKQKILEQLGKLYQIEYDTWWKICSAMQDSGYSLSEFEALSLVIRSHRKNNCKAQWNCSKRKHIQFGYLVNLCVESFGSGCLAIDKDKPKNESLVNVFDALKNRKLTLNI